jgi:hypothetical protein
MKRVRHEKLRETGVRSRCNKGRGWRRTQRGIHELELFEGRGLAALTLAWRAPFPWGGEVRPVSTVLGDVVSGVGGSPRRRTLTPLSVLSLRRSISRLASISSEILFASRSRASRSVRWRSVSLTGGATKRAKGSPCDCEPFRGFLGPSTTTGGGEGEGEWSGSPDMVAESSGEESSGEGLPTSRGKRRRSGGSRRRATHSPTNVWRPGIK